MLNTPLIMEDEEELERLGEKLYGLIYPRHAEMAGKLTGMLLELPGPVLAQILLDEAMLTEALNKALSALQPPREDSSEVERQGEDRASTSSDSLGEQLYKLVDVYDTGLTEKITGMLLEQKKLEVQKLLSNPGLLEERVNIALKILEEQSSEETDVSDFSDPDDAERLGEKLFAVVRQIDTAKCADITGMLLEMDHETLREVLSDRAMLETAVHKAQSALLGHHSHAPSDGNDSHTLSDKHYSHAPSDGNDSHTLSDKHHSHAPSDGNDSHTLSDKHYSHAPSDGNDSALSSGTDSSESRLEHRT
ncbi:uncharacterized protein LOC133141944 isoform X1 [Conger conger]|uniref:uncharacterized protein LOC133141944 isoform X1 n=1 Tax=Conger conger TaxID=82655 RepID=UPI002A59FFAB|nr:uncharacterized protein LOC133141944 isoform X1 [Conger conger]